MKHAMKTSIMFLTIFTSMPAWGSNVYLKALGGTDYDESWALTRTQDDGHVMTGYTRSFGTMTMHDVVLAKVDSSGTLLWTKTLGGSGTYDVAWSVIQSSDLGFVVAGGTNSWGAGFVDVLLAKFDSSGNYLWTTTFGGINRDEANSVVQTGDGGYIVSGSTNSFSAGGDFDVFLAKCDASGNLVWMKTFGGTKDESGGQVVRTIDGAYMMVGMTQSFSVGGDNDMFLAKFNDSGDILWMKTFGGTDEDRGTKIVQAQDGGYVVVGWTQSFGLPNHQIYIARFDSSGNSLWMKAIGMSSVVNDWGGYVVATDDGGYAVAGQTYPGSGTYAYYLLSKFDSSGNHLWTSTLGQSGWNSWVKSFAYCSDGGFLMGGETQGWGAGSSDMPLVKFNAQGNNCLASFASPTITSLTPSVTPQTLGTTSCTPTTTGPTPTITSPTLTVTPQCESQDLFPYVTDVVPSSVFNTVSSTLTIKGSNFNSGTGVSNVKIKGPVEINLTGWTVVSDTEIQNAVLASGAQVGIYDVIVTTSVGMNPVSSTRLTVSLPPTCGNGTCEPTLNESCSTCPADCGPCCGNGILDPGEACDPPASCPTTCDDGDACTTDTLVGSAALCTAACTHATITACAGGDGCCPAGCDFAADTDCPPPPCPNGVCEPGLGETCSNCAQDCPTGTGQVCCAGALITGDCCGAADCSGGDTCVGNVCVQLPADGGTDAGTDAGVDAGLDAGQDAGADAGSDPGRPDGGGGEDDGGSVEEQGGDAGGDNGATGVSGGCGCGSGSTGSTEIVLLALLGMAVLRRFFSKEKEEW